MLSDTPAKGFPMSLRKPPCIGIAILSAGLGLFLLCAPPITPLQKIGRLKYSNAAPVYIINRQIAPDTLTYIGEKATSISISPSLPNDLAFDPGTGRISGIPRYVFARAHFVVTATNQYNSDTAGLDITVSNPAPESLTYLFPSASYPVGKPITTNVPIMKGGPVDSFDIAPVLPAGLGIDKATGMVSGTPAQIGASSAYTITARNAAGSIQTTVTIQVIDTITIIAPPESLTYAITHPQYPVGRQIALNTPSYTGGTPDSFTVLPPLPQGLIINKSTGAISGVPAAVTPASVCTVTAKNKGGSSKAALTIAITDTAVVPANHKPAFVSGIDPVTAREGDTVKIAVVARDSDATDAVAFTLVNITDLKTAFGQTAVVWSTVKDTARLNLIVGAHTGTYPVTVRISDGKDSAGVTFNVTVGNVNHPPRWKKKIIDAAINEGQSYSLDLPDTCMDPDGDPLTFTLRAGAPATDAIGADSVYRFAAGYADSGHYIVTIEAKDDSGLVDLLTINLAVANVDTDHTAPTIRLFDPATDSATVTTSSRLIKIVAKDASRLSRVVFVFADTLAAGQAQDSIWSVTVSGLQVGYNTIGIVAWDSSANRNKAQKTLTIKYDPTAGDLIPPSIRLIDPAADGTTITASSKLVRVAVVDSSKVSRVVFVFGVDSISAAKTQDSIWSATVSPLVIGNNTISIVAWDSSTNKNKAQRALIIKYDPTAGDLIPPSIRLIDPAKDSSICPAASRLVKISASDASKIARVVFYTTDTVAATHVSDSTWSATITNLPAGAYSAIKAIAWDSSSHANRAEKTLYVKYDTTAPAIVVTSPAVSLTRDSAVVAASPINVAGTASSPFGIAKVILRVNGALASDTAKKSWGCQAALNGAQWNTVTVMAIDSIGAAARDTTTRTIRLFYVPTLSIPDTPDVVSALCDSIRFTWSAVQYCTQYLVYRSTTSSTTGFALVAGPQTATSFTDKNPSAGMAYYKVRGFYAASGGSFSVNDSTALSQVRTVPPPCWQKTAGWAGTDQANDIHQTGDGGYIAVGTTTSRGAGQSDVLLVKLLPSGDTAWTRTFGGPGIDEGNSVQQASDKGYIIAGLCDKITMQERAYIIKTDSLGLNPIIKKFGGDYGLANVIVEVQDGYVYGGGIIDSYGYMDIYIAKLSFALDSIWGKHYGGTNNDNCYGMTKTSDGGFIIAGVNGTSGTGGPYLLKVNSIGDRQWDTTYNWTNESEWNNLARQTSDGGYLIVGGAYRSNPLVIDVRLTKTDSRGVPIWTQKVSGPAGDFQPHDFIITPEGDYVIALESYMGGWQAALLKVGNNRITQWSFDYGGIDAEAGIAVCQTTDGGFALCGSTKSWGAGDRDMYFVKTDVNGKSTIRP